MKLALAFDAGRQAGWLQSIAALGLAGIAPVEIFACASVAELRAVAPDVVVGYASGFLAAYLRDAPPSLKWVHFMNAGVDEVARGADSEKPGFRASNVRGMHARPMAEFVLMAMLYFAKRVPRWTAARARRRWAPEVPAMLARSHALIVGAGSIGGGVARICKQLEMSVTGIATRSESRPHFDAVFLPEAMPAALAKADYVVCSLPLTEATRNIFDAASFAAMKPGAVFINVGRGEAVVEDALIGALRTGHLGGAAIDAFRAEPLPPESPLWDVPNLLLTPHVSGRFESGMQEGAEIFRENFRSFVGSGSLLTEVDLARGY